MEDYQRHYADKNVLVTGGGGAIGSNLCRTIGELGARNANILDDMSAAFEWNIPDSPNVLFVKGSITDEAALQRVFAMKPEIVYHLAAFFANQNSVDYPRRDLMVNGMGTLKLLEYSVLTGVERFIYASSGCSIHGSGAPLPLVEDFVSLHLTTPYQISKMLGELYGNFFMHHHGLQVVKTRFFNSYGPGEVPGQYRNVIPNFIFYAMLGMALPFTGAENASRDFTYVDDIVDGLLRAGYFDEAVGHEMNIASGTETRILDMARTVNEIVGNKAGIMEAPRRKWDTRDRLLASVDRARDLLGYVPRMPFEEGLKHTIKWFEDNWDDILRDAEYPPGTSSAVQGLTVRKYLPR